MYCPMNKDIFKHLAWSSETRISFDLAIVRKRAIMVFKIDFKFKIGLYGITTAGWAGIKAQQNITGTLQWRHNERDGVSNHQPNDCLLNRLFRRRSKKISKLRVTGLCAGNSPLTGEIPAQRSVTRKMLSFDDVIMNGVQISWSFL